jgi:hypothetical protein
MHASADLGALACRCQSGFFSKSHSRSRDQLLICNSTDKDFIVVEGATTGVTPCTNCANPAASYDNVTKKFFDYAAKWINDRFSSP